MVSIKKLKEHADRKAITYMRISYRQGVALVAKFTERSAYRGFEGVKTSEAIKEI